MTTSSVPSQPVLAGVRRTFRAAACAVIPDAASLDESGWRQVENIIETALVERPEKLRRQLATFLRLIRWLPVLRTGRTFDSLDADSRKTFLARLENSRLLLLRRGFWGLRTLALMGYYGRRSVGAEIGYRATAAGWDAVRSAGGGSQ
jgi:hypothetical protein